MYVVFLENKADGNVDTSHGPYIYNNLIVDNHSDFSGGGVAFFRFYKPTIDDEPQPLTSPGKYPPKPTLINNTIVNNTAPDGAGIFTMNHIPFFMNNILWNSYEPDAEWGEIFMGTVERWLVIEDNKYAGIEISYSCTQGGRDGKGNINSDPLFADTINYYLSEQSPCIDAGHDSSFFNDLGSNGIAQWPAMGSLRNDMGAYGGPVEYDPEELIGTNIPGDIQNLPTNFHLSQNYPNPFNPVTVIAYQLAKTDQVDLSIYNVIGQRVATLVSARQPAGAYQIHWDASELAGGVYFYRLSTDKGYVQTKKMVLIK
jgi:hypothetical protein